MKRKKYGQWISVADEVPEDDKRIIACNIAKPEVIWFACFDDNPEVMHDDSGYFCYTLANNKFTHWMRIKPINQKKSSSKAKLYD